MRKLIVGMQISLDGYIEGPGGAMDWFSHDDEALWAEEFLTLRPVDTVLLGRVTWAGYADYWKGVLAEPGSHSVNEVRFARWAEQTRHLVFSRTLEHAGWENAAIVRGDLEDEVRALKSRPGRDLIAFGGAALVRALLCRGLVDDLRLVVNPVLLGGGKRPFGELRRALRLRLERVRAIGPGTVLMHYMRSGA